jgi:hypothetical protein
LIFKICRAREIIRSSGFILYSNSLKIKSASTQRLICFSNIQFFSLGCQKNKELDPAIHCYSSRLGFAVSDALAFHRLLRGIRFYRG